MKRDLFYLLIIMFLLQSFPESFSRANTKNPDLKKSIYILEKYKNEIKGYRVEMDQLFDDEAAKDTLRKAFKKKGVKWAMRYVDSWGGWLRLTYHWSNNKGPRAYITFHMNSLDGSIKYIREKNYAVQKNMDYLGKGMVRWREKSKELKELLLNRYVVRTTNLAMTMDERNKVYTEISEISRRITSARLNNNESLARSLEGKKAVLQKRYDELKKEEEKIKAKRKKTVQKLNILISEPVFREIAELNRGPDADKLNKIDPIKKAKYFKEKARVEKPAMLKSRNSIAKTSERAQLPFMGNDEYGRPQVWVDSDGDGFLDTVRTYDYKGRPLYEAQWGRPDSPMINTQIRIRVYDSDGNYTEYIDTDNDGVMEDIITVNINNNRREEAIEEIITVDPDYGTMSRYTELDENGIAHSWEHYDSRGTLRERISFDAEGNSIEEAWDAEGNISEPETWTPEKEWQKTARERFRQGTGSEENPSPYGGGGASYEWTTGPEGIPVPSAYR
jgi:hypothetical protein